MKRDTHKNSEDAVKTKAAARSADLTEPKNAGHESLLDALDVLLQQQIRMAQTGNITKLERLAQRATRLVEQIARTEMLEQPQFRQRRSLLQHSYEDLCLAVSAQKQAVCRDLARVRKGKRTIEAYRSNI